MERREAGATVGVAKADLSGLDRRRTPCKHLVGQAQTPLRPRRIKKRKERYNGHAKSVSP